jgi:DmsE family decaheme c-type cytochrome
MPQTRYGRIWFLGLAILASLISLSPVGPAASAEDGYVETSVPDACRVCHPEIYLAFQRENPHWKSLFDFTASADRQGCESCHGPARKHINTGGKKEFIYAFDEGDTADRAKRCLKCHDKGKAFFQFQRSAHRFGGIPCSDCHRVHGSRPAGKLLKQEEPGLCFSCHPEIESKFRLPTRHKVLEGAMRCSDCHSPHGSRNRASLKRWNKFNVDVCFECHPEKRGPWVFEHPSVKFEGCMVCHAPHGSPNRFLLSHRDVRRVCIQCHGLRHQGDFLFSTEVCINCHTQIHGSNFSSRFFQ